MGQHSHNISELLQTALQSLILAIPMKVEIQDPAHQFIPPSRQDLDD